MSRSYRQPYTTPAQVRRGEPKDRTRASRAYRRLVNQRLRVGDLDGVSLLHKFQACWNERGCWEGEKQVPCGNGKKEKQRQGQKQKREAKAKSRFPAGMERKKSNGKDKSKSEKQKRKAGSLREWKEGKATARAKAKREARARSRFPAGMEERKV